jgi:hypothetical protein
MRWSLRIGEVSGIGVSIHLTFFLLIAWVGISHWLQSRSLGGRGRGDRVHPCPFWLRSPS